MVCKVGFINRNAEIEICVRPWSLLTILNFPNVGRETQRCFNDFSPSSCRTNKTADTLAESYNVDNKSTSNATRSNPCKVSHGDKKPIEIPK